MKYYRYSVKGLGGMFHAIDALFPENSFADTHDYDEIICYGIFDKFIGLKLPRKEDGTLVFDGSLKSYSYECFFTELGNSYFKEGINAARKILEDAGKILECRVLDSSDENVSVVYEDEYQVVLDFVKVVRDKYKDKKFEYVETSTTSSKIANYNIAGYYDTSANY